MQRRSLAEYKLASGLSTLSSPSLREEVDGSSLVTTKTDVWKEFHRGIRCKAYWTLDSGTTNVVEKVQHPSPYFGAFLKPAKAGLVRRSNHFLPLHVL